LDPLRGRRPCPLLQPLMNQPALGGRPVFQELDLIIHAITGRRLTRTIVGDHPTRQSLTDFLHRGAAQAAQIVPHVRPDETVLDYGGGIGRLGRVIAPHVNRVVSVDGDPLMKEYGRVISAGLDFLDFAEVPEAEQFDGAYSVGAFLRLSLDQQRLALEYVHCRLKPGAWFLVDLRPVAIDDFRALYEPLFTAKRLPLFNSGFLLRKRDPRAVAATPVADRYTVNEGSVVCDVLEGEVVVVNLDTGAYYILEGSASTVWQMLADGRRVTEIVDLVARHHAADAAAVAASVADFVAQLTGESLLVPATDQEPPPAFDPRMLPAAGAPFSPPVMYRYTDMQALIQMDPIRDYDETGWPRRYTPPPPPPSRTA